MAGEIKKSLHEKIMSTASKNKTTREINSMMTRKEELKAMKKKKKAKVAKLWRFFYAKSLYHLFTRLFLCVFVVLFYFALFGTSIYT